MSGYAFIDEWNQAKCVSFGEVKRQLDQASLSERNLILDFICSNHDRIRPAIDDDWLYDSMSTYLLDCIGHKLDTGGDPDSRHSRFEAAHKLVEWFQWIVGRDTNLVAIQQRTDRIATVFAKGDHSVRNCIETGFLEHVLEIPSIRPYFSHWKDDEILVESYVEALRWGEAHTKPNYPSTKRWKGKRFPMGR